MTTEFKPCPFCGDDDLSWDDAGDSLVLCTAVGCGASAPRSLWNSALRKSDVEASSEKMNDLEKRLHEVERLTHKLRPIR
jgi:hypothetical protein